MMPKILAMSASKVKGRQRKRQISSVESSPNDNESTAASNFAPVKKRRTIFEPEVIINTNLLKKFRKSTTKDKSIDKKTEKNATVSTDSVKKMKKVAVKDSNLVKKTKSSTVKDSDTVKKTKKSLINDSDSLKKRKSSLIKDNNSVKKRKSSSIKDSDSVKKRKSSTFKDGNSVKKTKKSPIQEKKNEKKSGKEKCPEEELKFEKLKDGSYVCKICKLGFSDRQKVRFHTKTYHDPTWFTCDYCDKKVKSKYQITRHINLYHRENPNDYKYCCDKCDYVSNCKYYLNTHIIRKHSEDYNYECDICKKRFKIKSDLKIHITSHDGSNHMCDSCGKMFTSEATLVRHRRVQHLNVGRYKFRCELCHQKVMTQESLDKHMRLHANVPTCDVCGLTFSKRRYITRHKKRVHDVSHFVKCKLCAKEFACKAVLRIHYLSHTKSKPYLCNVCGFTFSQRSSMMLHWKKQHPDAGAPPPPVVLTNIFDSLEAEIDKLVAAKAARETNNHDQSNNAIVDIHTLPTNEY